MNKKSHLLSLACVVIMTILAAGSVDDDDGTSSGSEGSKWNVEFDLLNYEQQNADLRRAGRCTSWAFPPNEDTHICGAPASYAYTVVTILRTKSTGIGEQSLSFMNKCEEHYMGSNAVESEVRSMYSSAPEGLSLVDLEYVDVSVTPLVR